MLLAQGSGLRAGSWTLGLGLRGKESRAMAMR